MNFTPLHDHVLIQPIEQKIESALIVIPENTEKEPPIWGKVLAFGPKRKDVAVGNIVLLPTYGAIDITIDGEKYKLVHEEDILGILE